MGPGVPPGWTPKDGQGQQRRGRLVRPAGGPVDVVGRLRLDLPDENRMACVMR